MVSFGQVKCFRRFTSIENTEGLRVYVPGKVFGKVFYNWPAGYLSCLCVFVSWWLISSMKIGLARKNLIFKNIRRKSFSPNYHSPLTNHHGARKERSGLRPLFEMREAHKSCFSSSPLFFFSSALTGHSTGRDVKTREGARREEARRGNRGEGRKIAELPEKLLLNRRIDIIIISEE